MRKTFLFFILVVFLGIVFCPEESLQTRDVALAESGDGGVGLGVVGSDHPEGDIFPAGLGFSSCG